MRENVLKRASYGELSGTERVPGYNTVYSQRQAESLAFVRWCGWLLGVGALLCWWVERVGLPARLGSVHSLVAETSLVSGREGTQRFTQSYNRNSANHP
jgi:hypothetical protein